MEKLKKRLLIIGLIVFNTQTFAKENILQSVENIEEYSSHDGNYFKLVQLDRGCRIDARFYLSNQNHLYHYYLFMESCIKQAIKYLNITIKRAKKVHYCMSPISIRMLVMY